MRNWKCEYIRMQKENRENNIRISDKRNQKKNNYCFDSLCIYGSMSNFAAYFREWVKTIYIRLFG
jgi:hypothetical protein